MSAQSLTEKLKAWSAAHPEAAVQRQAQRERNQEERHVEHKLADLLGSLLRSIKNGKKRGGFKALVLATAPLMAGAMDQQPAPAWMDTPEKRRLVWVWQAVAAVFQGDQKRAEECGARAHAEDARCVIRLLKSGSLLPPSDN